MTFICDMLWEARRPLAVPFLGKDVPSEASEFAHPEVLIGMSVSTMRCEGTHVLHPLLFGEVHVPKILSAFSVTFESIDHKVAAKMDPT